MLDTKCEAIELQSTEKWENSKCTSKKLQFFTLFTLKPLRNIAGSELNTV